MNEVREIVTRAVIAKGKKIFKICETVTPTNTPFSVLGCWIINHQFEACLNEKKVDLDGSFEINIWYAYDNNTKTDVSKSYTNYSGSVRVREIICDNISSQCDVIARVLQQPTCTNASITEKGIEVDVVLEEAVDVIGETKIAVTAFSNIDTDTIDESFENEINENFINENIVR